MNYRNIEDEMHDAPMLGLSNMTPERMARAKAFVTREKEKFTKRQETFKRIFNLIKYPWGENEQNLIDLQNHEAKVREEIYQN